MEAGDSRTAPETRAALVGVESGGYEGLTDHQFTSGVASASFVIPDAMRQ